MDPLSVAASVAGLVSLAGQLVPALYNLGSAVKEASKDAQAAAAEVAGMSVVLQGLQTYIIGRQRANPRRLRLITVEHITASLTACVLTYSELDEVLKALHADSGLKAWDRAVWFMKREGVQNLIVRIQNHKSTFSCMLNILQCDSAGEAERSMDRLCDQVGLLLSENKELSARLRNLEHLSTTEIARRKVASSPRNNIHPTPSNLSRSSSMSQDTFGQSSISSRLHGALLVDPTPSKPDIDEPPRVSAFEEQLHRSRVYRHAHANHSESSLVDDGRSTLALSICSSLTLGEVSKISVFALPVFADDLSNSSAYSFTRPSEPAQIIAPHQAVSRSAVDTSPKSSERLKGFSTYLRVKLRSGRTKSALQHAELEEEPKPGIFGVPLESSIRYANVAISLTDDNGQSYIYGYLPIVVGKVGIYLKNKAVNVENIFATGSSPLKLQQLQLVFDSPIRKYGTGLDWTDYTVHEAANVLLRYLLQLPESVIPLAFYARFREALRGHQARAVGLENGEHDENTDISENFDENTTIQTYQTLINEMPALSRQLLLYLLDMLAVFASRSEVNMMTTQRLAAVFQPAVLRQDQNRCLVSDKQLSQDVLDFLIQHQENFLIGLHNFELDSDDVAVAQSHIPLDA